MGAGYKLRRKRHENSRRVLRKRLVVLAAFVGLALIVWQVWIGLAQMLPAQTPVKLDSNYGCITTSKHPNNSRSEVCPE